MWPVKALELYANHVPVEKIPELYLHFTDDVSAQQIVESGELHLSRTVVNAVFAAAVGGTNVEGVQHARSGADKALLFTPEQPPELLFPEEVVWHRTVPLRIKVHEVLDAYEARKLLDGTAQIQDDGWWHTPQCQCDGCECHKATVLTVHEQVP